MSTCYTTMKPKDECIHCYEIEVKEALIAQEQELKTRLTTLREKLGLEEFGRLV